MEVGSNDAFVEGFLLHSFFISSLFSSSVLPLVFGGYLK